MLMFGNRQEFKEQVDHEWACSYQNTDDPVLNGKAVNIINPESNAGERNKYDLECKYNNQNNQKQAIPGDTFKNIELFMQFLTVNKIKELQHNKGIEDKSKMPREYSKLRVYFKIIRISINLSKPTTPYSTSNLTIMPFIFRMSGKYLPVMSVFVFWNQFLSQED